MDRHHTGRCFKCGEPIEYGEGYYTFDANIGACAAGAGNLHRAHSTCFREATSFVEPPKSKPCACLFLQEQEFGPWSRINECGFHSSMRKAIEAAEQLLRDGGTVPIKGETWKKLHDILTKKP